MSAEVATVTKQRRDPDVYLHTIQCLTPPCMQRTRLGIHQYEGVNIGTFKFCPVCGNKAYSNRDLDRNYWEILADGYGLTPEIVQEMYTMWDRSVHIRFGDFVNELKKEAGI